MARIVNIHEANNQLSKRLEQAHAGEEIILASPMRA
jgi:antitoxin (DNA-binding transcriptional repressor) of toxin-antitoxin stability system